MNGQMNGGKLIFNNPNTCIFKPSIPCKNEKKQSNHITKISVTPYDSNRQVNEREKKINQMIKKIRGHEQWAVIFDTFCKPTSINGLAKYDKDVYKCVKGMYGDAKFNEWKDAHFPSYPMDIDNQFKMNQMMNGKYGGITLETYFQKNLEQTNNFETKFLDLMKSMKTLFHGLVEMGKKDIIHGDIKFNNIVYDKNTFKFIDFGLSGTIKDKVEFKKRALSEFHGNRLYIWYPLDFLYFYANNKDLIHEPKYIHQRNYSKYFQAIHGIWKRPSVETLCKYTIDSVMYNTFSENDMLRKIDVYSLGIQIPFLFIQGNLIYHLQSSLIVQDFFNLFYSMTHPDVNTRISAIEAYELYNEIMKKYTKEKVVHKRVTPRRETRRRRRVTPRRETRQRRR